jgi:hypothetical protein
MTKTVIGLVDTPAEADAVVAELLKEGFDRERIGVIANEHILDAAAGAAGATRGMAYGSLAGLLAGVGALAIPGVGAVVAVGPALALLTTAIGAVAGGLIGGLVSRGVPKEDAHVYAEGLRRGGTLIMVEAKNDQEADRVAQTLARHGVVDVKERAAQWRGDGWSGRFDQARGPAGSPAPRAAT